MNLKDIEIKSEIENILKSNSISENLKIYFENLPFKKIRRAITILSRIYPDKVTISDEEFPVIVYFISNKNFIEQENFMDLVRSINIITFTESQKEILIKTINNNIEALCKACTFELDKLLVNLFSSIKLIQYIEVLAGGNNMYILKHVLDILMYEKLPHSNILDESVEILKQKVLRKIYMLKNENII